MKTQRRQFLGRAGATLLGMAAVSRAAQGAVPEAAIQTSPETQRPLAPAAGRLYNPVVTLNGWTAPFRMNNGVKEFHLVAEPDQQLVLVEQLPLTHDERVVQRSGRLDRYEQRRADVPLAGEALLDQLAGLDLLVQPRVLGQ